MRPSRLPLFLFLVFTVALSSLFATGPDKLPTAPARAQLGHHRADCTLEFSQHDAIGMTFAATGVNRHAEPVDGTPYERLDITGTTPYGQEGAPDVPVYRTLVVIPECDDADITVRVANTAVLHDIDVSPASEYRYDSLTGTYERRFVRDAAIYETDATFPERWAWIERIDYMRDQKIATVAICPVRVNPVKRTAKVATRLDVTLELDGARGPQQVDVGPMAGILGSAALNYTVPAAPPPGKPGPGRPQASTAVGNVYWCGSSDDDWEAAADSVAFVGQADYLILMADGLDSALVDTLAQHRADRDAFNVSVVNLNQIDSTPDTSATPVAIRSFIKRIYDHATAAHMSDDHLGYVVLIGDAYDPDDTVLLPPYYGFEFTHAITHEQETMATDAYFTFLSDSTGLEDVLADVYIGRLSVNLVDGANPNIQLANVVHKITAYGRPQNVGKKSLMVSGNLYSIFEHSAFTLPWQEADEYFSEIHSRYLAGHIDTSDVRHREEAGDLNSDPISAQFSDSLCERISDENYWLISMIGHGSAFNLGETFLWQDYDFLDNDFPAVFQFAGCEIGRFDYRGGGCPPTRTGALDPCDAVTEILTVHEKGAIGAIAWTRVEGLKTARYAAPGFFESVFTNNAHRLGEILVAMRLRGEPGDTQRHLTLFGDPALNIMWEAGSDPSDIDIAVTAEDFRVPDAAKGLYVDCGASVSVEIDVVNNWKVDADSIYLTLWEGSPSAGTLLDSVYIGPIGAYDTSTYSGSVTLSETGSTTITAVVGTVDDLTDLDEENNRYARKLYAARYESGFPIDLGSAPRNAVTMADVAEDHAGKEIIVNSQAGTSCYRGDGRCTGP